ncbi:21985_t:CDS:2, partial [Racocetra persica]
EKARELNKKIFANMYYAALDESCNLAREHGSYDNYKGSPVSKGILQYDMCDSDPCSGLDWDSLKQRIKKYGVQNSLLIALMPTASTSQCVGTGYSKGPFPDESNLMFRETTGEILDNNGSVQNIKEFPEEMKAIYKTAFEYSYKTVIDHAV